MQKLKQVLSQESKVKGLGMLKYFLGMEAFSWDGIREVQEGNFCIPKKVHPRSIGRNKYA